MNRLSLAQRLSAECGVSGTLTATAGQSGSLARLVNWIDTAWQELQSQHNDWEFLRSSHLLGSGASFATVSGTASYPLGTGAGTCGVTAALFGKWDECSFRVHLTATGFTSETRLGVIGFDKWREAYMYGANRSVTTRPAAVAIGPDKSICLGPPPDGTYTVTGDYYSAPTAMAADGDTPTGLPEKFHMAIVYKAMEYYGAYEAAPEVAQRGAGTYAKLLAALETTYAPRISFGGPLA